MPEYDYDKKDITKDLEEGDEEGELSDDAAGAAKILAEAAAARAANTAQGASGAEAAAANAVRNGAALSGVAEAIRENAAEAHTEKPIHKEGKLVNSAEALLSRTERLLLNSLSGALKSGDIKSVQEMLATVAESNPKAQKAIMNAIKERLEISNPLNTVRWETGTDNNGQAFVRLHIDQRHSYSKSSGSTQVMVGSDGVHSASSTKRWDSQSNQLNPGDALQSITAPFLSKLMPKTFKPGADSSSRLQDLLENHTRPIQGTPAERIKR